MALLVLAWIGHDLADAGCDPLLPDGGPALAGTAAGDAGDPCDDGCVPDCFCCCVTLAAADIMSMETPLSAARHRPALRPLPTTGAGSVPDPVPRPSS